MISKIQRMRDTNLAFNHRAEIWREVEAGRDSHGEKTFRPELVHKVWAQIIPTRGAEYRDNLDVYQAQTYKVTLRYSKRLDATYWIVFNGKRLDIEAVMDLQSRTMYQELICTERIETDGRGDEYPRDFGIY